MINKICAILIDSNVVVSVLKNKQWPSQSNVESNKNTFYKTIYVRPTVKLQQKANKILENDMDWINRTIDIKTAWSEGFRAYVKSLDVCRQYDLSRFYKIADSLIKYKPISKLVKGVLTDNWV